MLMLVSVFALASCGDPEDPCANGHVDADGNEKCDVCDADVPKQPDNNGGGEPLPEEPEREPTYKIEFYYSGINSDFERDIDEDKVVSIVKDAAGNPKRIVNVADNLLYTLDVIQNTAPTEDQVAEILDKDFTYGGITIIDWYDSPEKTNKVDVAALLQEVATQDVKLYAELRTEVPDKKTGLGYAGENLVWEVMQVKKETVLYLRAIKSGDPCTMFDFTYPELVPWYYDEEGNRRTITKINFEDGAEETITNIGSFAFYNVSISEPDNIEMPASIKTIGAHAFAYSRLLKAAPLTEYIETIGRSAFEGCEAFTTIDIPDSVKSIGGYAFFDCLKYKNLILGSGLQEIGEFAFHHHSKKTNAHEYTYYRGTEADFAKIVIGIGTDKFYSWGAYAYFYAGKDADGNPIDPTKVAGPYWQYDSAGEPKYLSFTIRYKSPDKRFPLLTDYVLVGSDGKGAYTQENKDKLAAITYRGYKFESWGNEKYLSGENKITKHMEFTGRRGFKIGDDMYYEVVGSTTLYFKGTGSTWDFEGAGDIDYTTTTASGANGSSCMGSISSVKFEAGVTRIGSNALSGLTSIVYIEIPATVTEVAPNAFAACPNLAAIYYEGDTLCKGLDSLVDTKAKAYAKGSSDSTADGSFWQSTANAKPCFECGATGKITYANGTQVDCKACSGAGTRVYRLAWSYIDGVLTIGGENVMPDFAVGEAPWTKYESVKELKFANNITTIGENAFNGMKDITKITLNDNLVNIPISAFKDSGYWKEAKNWRDGALMSGSADEVGKHMLAFDPSKSSTTAYYTIPQAVKIITADAFSLPGCENIKAIVLPKYIDEIDPTAFAGLTAVERIYYYGENLQAWSTLENLPANWSSIVLFRATKQPAENAAKYWRMVSKVPTPWA